VYKKGGNKAGEKARALQPGMDSDVGSTGYVEKTEWVGTVVIVIYKNHQQALKKRGNLGFTRSDPG
jgi:hypothetical protein